MKGKGLIVLAAFVALLLLAPACNKRRSKKKHAPEITRLDPNTGGEGDVTLIEGRYFSTNVLANQVLFTSAGSTVEATVLLARSDVLTVLVPTGTDTGPVKVVVSGRDSNELIFTAIKNPKITRLVPDFGPEGALVTIQGRHFGPLRQDNLITFDGVPTPALTVLPSELTCFVPPGAVSGNVQVMVGPDTSNAVYFEVTTPRLYSVQAFYGVVGSAIVLSGENFSPDPAENIVRIAGVQSPVQFASSFGDSLSIAVPPAARTAEVTVEVAGGRGITNGMPFCLEVVQQPPTPSISALSAISGAVGDPILIVGVNFSPNAADNVVRFNGTIAPSLSGSDTTLNTEIPVGATTGPLTLEIGGLVATWALPFTVTTPPPPSPGLIEIVPPMGAEGDFVTIIGTDFSPDRRSNRAFFNGVEAEIFGSSANAMLVRVPLTSSGPVTVNVAGQPSAGGLPFTVTGLAATNGTFTCFGQSLVAPTDSVIFVIDISGTMSWRCCNGSGVFTDRFGSLVTSATRLDLVKDRTAAAIDALPSGFQFNIFVYDCGPLSWQPSMQIADATNKADAINNFLTSLVPSGSSDTGISVAAALAAEPTNRTILLVSDGSPSCGPTSLASHLCEIRTANTQRAQVHTFAVDGFGDFQIFMQDVADLTGGTYNVAN
ncbi:MAG: IPT/TIG domain-containing protein [Planctomycetota bacterium]|nr:IPT/TIG domain-containing protein [Planctomycetota bacterium]